MQCTHTFVSQVSSAQDDQVSVRVIAMGKDVVRISFHLDIEPEDVVQVCKKLKFLLTAIKNSE